MKPEIFEALVSLRPSKNFSYKPEVGGYEGINYDTEANGDTCPTKEELEAELTRLQKEYTDTEYQRKRVEEYPDWGVQLDYIYHNGLDKWKTDIVDPVKAKYPKPS